MKTSASQLDKVQNCVRAAAFHYNDRIRKPSGAQFAADLGKRIHDINRQYVRFGLEPDLTEIMWKVVTNRRTGLTTNKPVFPGQIAQAAFPLLKRGPIGTEFWYTETKVDGVTLPSGVEIVGDIDLAIDYGETGEIRDYKTTSDFKYALTEALLLENIQSNFYSLAWFKAAEAGRIRSSARAVNLHWQYLLTKGDARSHSVRALMTRERNEHEIARIDRELATPWVQIRLNRTSGYYLPPTGLGTGACEKFNGCPYRGLECQITVEDSLRFGGTMSQIDLNQLLNNKLASQQALTQAAPPAGFGPPPGANPFAAPQGGFTPPSGPATPQPLGRPSFWIPGDPLNEIQEFAQSKGKPLSFIANAADNPPPPEVAASYDNLPKVEAGNINPPESGGMVPAANPTVAAALMPVVAPSGVTPGGEPAEAGFEALKAECMRLGIYPAGSKPRTAGLKKLLDAYDVERAKAEALGLISPGTRPTANVVYTSLASHAAHSLHGTPAPALLPGPVLAATPAPVAQAFLDGHGTPQDFVQALSGNVAGAPDVQTAVSPEAIDWQLQIEAIAQRTAEIVIARLAEALGKLA